MLTPERVRDGARELADGTEIVVGAATLLGGEVADGRLAAFTRSLTQDYGIDPDQAERVPIAGGPAQAAERLAAYADAGATWVVMGTIDADWHRGWERVAEARSLLH
jgi:alkanesulfonate monooxygenase SsuD/methylene tetrahydromethanopterin reductase-like flavin-dependent oxidoreductase (luciferase family)